jgi:hypothetical protein
MTVTARAVGEARTDVIAEAPPADTMITTEAPRLADDWTTVVGRWPVGPVREPGRRLRRTCAVIQVMCGVALLVMLAALPDVAVPVQPVADPGPSCGTAARPHGFNPPTRVGLASPDGVAAGGWARWCESTNATFAGRVFLVIDIDPAALAVSDVHRRFHDVLPVALFVPTATDRPWLGREWAADVGHGPAYSPSVQVGPRGFADAWPGDYRAYFRSPSGSIPSV